MSCRLRVKVKNRLKVRAITGIKVVSENFYVLVKSTTYNRKLIVPELKLFKLY